MKMEKMNKGIIVIGASGLIGGYLFDEFRKSGKEVEGTYNKHEKPGMVYFDVTKSSLNNLNINNVGYAVICSAIIKIDECKKNPEYSREVNVNGLKRVIKEFSEKGIIPVFISTASVFNGNGNYKEKDLTNPVNEYGQQKKEVEDFIIKNINEYLIIRIGKAFGVNENGGIFIEWLNEHKKNEEILCIDDEELSLTYAGDIARGIEILMEKNKREIYHIDSMIRRSRYEFALDFFNYLGIKDAKIKKCTLKYLNFIDERAKNQFLDSSKFIRETGFKFTPLEKCYDILKELFKI